MRTTLNVLPERAPCGRPRRELPETDRFPILQIPSRPTIEVVLPKKSPEFDNISASPIASFIKSPVTTVTESPMPAATTNTQFDKPLPPLPAQVIDW
jgi:hypothetical protein